MRISKVAGLVFANTNDACLKELTEQRATAAVPFGTRYRFIDFHLSNLVNAGITDIGLVTTENYGSLINHVGGGIYWDLDRKHGGLHVITPYMTNKIKRFKGTVSALSVAEEYIKQCGSEYIVLCESHVICNVDISAVIKSHMDSNADITLVYSKGTVSSKLNDEMILSLDGDGRVKSISFDNRNGEINYGIGITVISTKLLSELVANAKENEMTDFNIEVLADKVGSLKIMGFYHDKFTAVMREKEDYYNANMALLDCDIRKELFCKDRPVYTRGHDEMPTRYGINADVKNCYIAEGCIIDGTVKNSILFRGVNIEKGAVVENSILTQGSKICKGASVDRVITEKNAVISENMTIKGTENNSFFARNTNNS